MRPWVMRETSIRSSTSRVRWRSWRSSACSRRSSAPPAELQLEHVHRAAHRRQRIAQLVRQGGQELVLAAVGRRQLRVERLELGSASSRASSAASAPCAPPAARVRRHGGPRLEQGPLVVNLAVFRAPHDVDQHGQALLGAGCAGRPGSPHRSLHLQDRQAMRVVEQAGADGSRSACAACRPVRLPCSRASARGRIHAQDQAVASVSSRPQAACSNSVSLSGRDGHGVSAGSARGRPRSRASSRWARSCAGNGRRCDHVQGAARQVPLQVVADRARRDQVVAALQDQGRRGRTREVGAVVGQEGHAREMAAISGSLRQKLSVSSWRSSAGWARP
jgi:hypothetical protein